MTPGKTSLLAALVVQAVVVAVALFEAFGADLTAGQIAAITGAAGFLGLVATLVVWAFTVDRRQVLELLVGDSVVAGDANDMVPAGSEIRQIEPKP